MRKLLLLALPLASLLLLAGCDESQYQSSSGYNTPAATQQTPATAAAQQPAYQPPRNSTTQSLPAGWGYIHEQDLTGGRLGSAPAQPTPATARTGGS